MTVRFLVWDDLNVEHIAKHDVKPAEVEQVCKGQHVARDTYDNRVVIIGPTGEGRLLFVVLSLYAYVGTPEEPAFYTVSARPADRKERRIYEDELEVGGDEI